MIVNYTNYSYYTNYRYYTNYSNYTNYTTLTSFFSHLKNIQCPGHVSCYSAPLSEKSVLG